MKIKLIFTNEIKYRVQYESGIFCELIEAQSIEELKSKTESFINSQSKYCCDFQFNDIQQSFQEVDS